ncbi:MAG: TerB family tellurite resistance protein [Myxococcales bacterium]|nr:TerB family tellurite resistance protein [Myxococcales bacterium]
MSGEKRALGLDVYIALAAVGWADGNLDADEADAIVRMATEEGLGLSDITEIEKATKFPVDIGEIDRRGMSKEDKLFVYAVAAWMTWLDGNVSEDETAALARLGDALKIPDRPREHADAIMREVAHQSEDIRPHRFDLGTLRRIIHERLTDAQTARAAEPTES